MTPHPPLGVDTITFTLIKLISWIVCLTAPCPLHTLAHKIPFIYWAAAGGGHLHHLMCRLVSIVGVHLVIWRDRRWGSPQCQAQRGTNSVWSREKDGQTFKEMDGLAVAMLAGGPSVPSNCRSSRGGETPPFRSVQSAGIVWSSCHLISRLTERQVWKLSRHLINIQTSI